MHSYRHSRVLLMTGFIAIGLALGCAEERPLQPLQSRFNLYAACIQSKYIFTIDCETDSIIDSLPWQLSYDPYGRSGQVFASSRPGILIAPDASGHQVVDMTNHEVVASLGAHFRSFAFFPEYGRIVGSGYENTVIFEDTTYSVRHELDLKLQDCERIGNSTRCIGASWYLSSRWPLIIFNVVTGEIVDSLLVNPDDDGDFLWHTGFDISGDGARIYGSYLPDAAPDWSITGIDIIRKVSLFNYPMNTVECDAGTLYLTPNERELWLEWDLSPWCGGSGGLRVLDALSGAYSESIDLGNPLDDYVAIKQVKFLPEEPKAYAAVIGPGEGRNAVVVLNSETHDLIKVLHFGERQYPIDLAIGPAQ